MDDQAYKVGSPTIVLSREDGDKAYLISHAWTEYLQQADIYDQSTSTCKIVF